MIIQINYLVGKNKGVAIARAFMNNPDLILADEPTAS
ncbi:ATP-binding cassette domain-containing protein [Bacillus paranthracis]